MYPDGTRLTVAPLKLNHPAVFCSKPLKYDPGGAAADETAAGKAIVTAAAAASIRSLLIRGVPPVLERRKRALLHLLQRHCGGAEGTRARVSRTDLGGSAPPSPDDEDTCATCADAHRIRLEGKKS